MKRIALLILLAAVAAGGIYYAARQAPRTPHAAVTALLPVSTVGFAHAPDFARTRDEWRASDIYKLYREPAVQEFLKPVNSAPRSDSAANTLNDLEKLDPKDAFLALTSVENNNPHLIGGFRFHGNQSDAEQIINKWRLQAVKGNAAHETVDYETHKIDIVGAAPNQVATVYDGQWFFASNDLPELKTLLDRADGRAKDQKLTLEGDALFRAAIAHMPSSYSLLFYFQPKKISGSVASLQKQFGPDVSGDAFAAVEQIQSLCGAAKFDNGKIRDVFFVGTPRSNISQELTRNSIKLGSSDTFLFVAALLNPDRFVGAGQTGTTVPLSGWFQKVFEVAARTGVTVDEWKAAFDLEASALAEWPQTAHVPSIVAVLPVKDPARAFKISDGLTKAIDEDAPWRKAEKNGVRYYYMQSPVALFAITPTIAVSNKRMIIGLDSVSVEAAMNRLATKPPSTLEDSAAYRAATRAVPNPTTGFVYLDTALLYARLDSALRPVLLMGAAFMPAIGEYVDVTKWPPPEVVEKHLSPMVLSQRYDHDGYVTESVGPVSLDIGLGLPAVGWLIGHETAK
ncbi:MAG TPA: hypothetical protein VFA58_02150 [Chthoniobacterales bacterium]|nr:hypothetical protein [Chthoniobacterales bacterium]